MQGYARCFTQGVRLTGRYRSVGYHVRPQTVRSPVRVYAREARHGTAPARHGTARHGRARQTARHGRRHGTARHGAARHGT
eukprot:6447318-Prymnesium_polylepis.1